MKNPRLLSIAAFAALLVGCGGSDGHSSKSFAGAYSGSFAQSDPSPNSVSGQVAFTIANDGTITGTTTDSRYTGTGTVASGSKVDKDGDVTLIVTYSGASPVVTTTQSGSFDGQGTSIVTGTLTEAGESNLVLTYALRRNGG